MTLSEFLTTLAGRVVQLESRVSAIAPHEPSAGASAADLARLQGDIASLHAQVSDLTAAFRANAAAIAALRHGVDNATAAAELDAASANRARSDVDALAGELAEVKARQGDLEALPAL